MKSASAIVEIASPKPSNPYLSVSLAKCPVILPPFIANLALSSVHADAASVFIALKEIFNDQLTSKLIAIHNYGLFPVLKSIWASTKLAAAKIFEIFISFSTKPKFTYRQMGIFWNKEISPFVFLTIFPVRPGFGLIFPDFNTWLPWRHQLMTSQL